MKKLDNRLETKEIYQMENSRGFDKNLL